MSTPRARQSHCHPPAVSLDGRCCPSNRRRQIKTLEGAVRRSRDFINLLLLFSLLYVVDELLNKNKKYVLSNSESVQCDFFIFDHVMFIQFKSCCCVQTFIKIRWFFSLRYGDISIFKIAAVRHLGIVLPPYETTHEVFVARRSCMSNFMSIWYTDLMILAIWIFRIFGLKCLFRPYNWGFWGTLGP